MNDYRILERLSAGSFGSVFKIERETDGAEFVLKRVPLTDMDAAARAQAKLEVDLMRQLHHPHVVPYRDAFIFNNEDLCIVMDWFGGGDLATKVNANQKGYSIGKGVSERQAMLWFVEIALALHYLHSHRIIHRDLKPQNVFIDSTTGEVAVGDFGVAKLFEGNPSGAPSGTPMYMAPEVLQGQPSSFKSDIWSLGCLLYELLTGRHPFNATDISGLVINVVRGEYSPIPAHYSTDVARLIERMLERDQRRRPNIDELLMSPFVKQHVHTFLAVRIPKESPTSQGETMLRSQMQVLGISDHVVDVNVELEKTRSLSSMGGGLREGYGSASPNDRSAAKKSAPGKPVLKKGKVGAKAAKKSPLKKRVSIEDEDDDDGWSPQRYEQQEQQQYHDPHLGRNRLNEGRARDAFFAPASHEQSVTPMNAISTPAFDDNTSHYLQSPPPPAAQHCGGGLAWGDEPPPYGGGGGVGPPAMGRRSVGGRQPSQQMHMAYGGELEQERAKKKAHESELYSQCKERDDAFISAKLAKQRMLYGSPARSTQEIVDLARTPSPTPAYGYGIAHQHASPPPQPGYNGPSGFNARQSPSPVPSSSNHGYKGPTFPGMDANHLGLEHHHQQQERHGSGSRQPSNSRIDDLEDEVNRYRRLIADQVRQINELQRTGDMVTSTNESHLAHTQPSPQRDRFSNNRNQDFATPVRGQGGGRNSAPRYSPQRAGAVSNSVTTSPGSVKMKQQHLRQLCVSALGEETFAQVYEYYRDHPIPQRSAQVVKSIVTNASAWHVLPVVEELLALQRSNDGGSQDQFMY